MHFKLFLSIKSTLVFMVLVSCPEYVHVSLRSKWAAWYTHDEEVAGGILVADVSGPKIAVPESAGSGIGSFQ